MLRFGALVEEKLDLKQQARPLLIQLRDQVNETIHLAVLGGDLRVVYLEKLPTKDWELINLPSWNEKTRVIQR